MILTAEQLSLASVVGYVRGSEGSYNLWCSDSPASTSVWYPSPRLESRTIALARRVPRRLRRKDTRKQAARSPMVAPITPIVWNFVTTHKNRNDEKYPQQSPRRLPWIHLYRFRPAEGLGWHSGRGQLMGLLGSLLDPFQPTPQVRDQNDLFPRLYEQLRTGK